MDPQTPAAELIARARRGDRGAFDALAAACRERLLGLVAAGLGPSLRRDADVDDVIQETLLRAYRGLERFEPLDEDSFFRWLGGIARNVIHEVARRRGRELILALDNEIPAGGVSPSTAAAREERFERLQRALDGLEADHRRVILLARVERLPMAEVGRRLERSPEAASQLLWRALKKLKEAFGATDSFRLPDRRLEDRGGRDD